MIPKGTCELNVILVSLGVLKFANLDMYSEVAIKKTDYGVIKFETCRESSVDQSLMAFCTTGNLVSENEETIGKCCFFVLRKKRNQPQMSAEEITDQLDAISQSVMEIGEVLLSEDEFSLEYYFNTSCLLIADRIWIEAGHRGSNLWKTLYFLTMEEALRPLRKTPEEFFFKAFPLAFENKVTDENRLEFTKARRDLTILYAIHLNAKRRACQKFCV